MSTPTRRRITLLDGLMLIAATAVGLTLMRFSINGIRDRPLARSGGALIQSQITAGQTYASCFLAPWSLALLALHFRKAGAPSRRETWGPGFIACVAATTGLALYVAPSLMRVAMGKLSLSPVTLSMITGASYSYAAVMVVGAWLSLTLDSRWRGETDWLGWAGRVVGVGWIVAFLIGWLRVMF